MEHFASNKYTCLSVIFVLGPSSRHVACGGRCETILNMCAWFVLRSIPKFAKKSALGNSPSAEKVDCVMASRRTGLIDAIFIVAYHN